MTTQDPVSARGEVVAFKLFALIQLILAAARRIHKQARANFADSPKRTANGS